MKRGLILVPLLLGVLAITAWLITKSSRSSSAGDPAQHRASGTNVQPGKPTPPKGDLHSQLHEVTTNANQPISFFGKVIDQDANPIQGVKVTFQIRYVKEIGPVSIGDTFASPVAVTGVDGRFELTGAKGSLLTLKAIEKEGYEPSPKAFDGTFWYWRDKDPYRPDIDNPVIVRMWKKNGAERLTVRDVMTRIPYDGTPVTYDLLVGRETAMGGDLRATLTRNPRQITYGQRNYEWTLTLEAIDGGLIESADEQMYRAPSRGYEPRIEIHMPADAPKWTDMKTVRLYLKSRGGRNYGRVDVTVMVGSDRKETGFSYHSFINPNGSQNLEYDPLQDVIRSGVGKQP